MRPTTLDLGTERTWVLVFETGDEVMGEMQRFAEAHHLSAARFGGIGAFSEATLGYFDWEQKDYLPIEVREQVEVLSLTGDIALDGRKPAVHAHVVVGRRDGSASGGHLLRALVRPTLELMLTESPAVLRKSYDRETGLSLIDAARSL